MTGNAYFRVEEASIADIHVAYKKGVANANTVTQSFLDRIEAYDRKGPALWTIVVANPNAISDADALDEHFEKTGQFVGPLHGLSLIHI